jgi:hypothetical protein
MGFWLMPLTFLPLQYLSRYNTKSTRERENEGGWSQSNAVTVCFSFFFFGGTGVRTQGLALLSRFTIVYTHILLSPLIPSLATLSCPVCFGKLVIL